MRKDLVDIVCCPADKARLDLRDEARDEHGDILTGSLVCTQCGFPYPIEDGIPNLLPPEYHIPPDAGQAGGAMRKGASGGAAKGKGTPKGAAKRNGPVGGAVKDGKGEPDGAGMGAKSAGAPAAAQGPAQD